MSDIKEKAKKLAQKLRQKKDQEEKSGNVKITNVDAPNKAKKKKVKKEDREESDKKRAPAKGQVVGPKGGVYQTTVTGGKKYGLKKSLEDFIEQEDAIERTISKVKAEQK